MKPLLAVAASALLLIGATAGTAAAADPGATASANVNRTLKKQNQRLKQLTKQINRLQQQLEDLQGQNGSARQPSGPARGDLTGTYPNPFIAPGAVGSAKIASNAVTNPKLAAGSVTGPKIVSDAVTNSKLADGSVSGPKIADNTVGSVDIHDGAVGQDEFGSASVGSLELKSVTPVVSSGVSIGSGQRGTTEVTCPAGKMVIGGGYAWRFLGDNRIIASTPSERDPNGTWVVRGLVPAGAPANSLFAWANCLNR